MYDTVQREGDGRMRRRTRLLSDTGSESTGGFVNLKL